MEHIVAKYRTASKIPLRECYESSREPAPPGSFPFTRGIQSSSQILPQRSRSVRCIDACTLREAGATAIEELAFSISLAIDYAQKKGDNFNFLFSVQNDFFEEIAKFRAARAVWAKITKKKMRLIARTSSSILLRPQPKNNVTRITYQALAAVLGGAESIQISNYDTRTSSAKESAWLSTQIQHILRDETGVASVVDPLGGSHLIETLTREIEKRALALIKKIDTMGGIQKAIKKRFPKINLQVYREK